MARDEEVLFVDKIAFPFSFVVVPAAGIITVGWLKCTLIV